MERWASGGHVVYARDGGLPVDLLNIMGMQGPAKVCYLVEVLLAISHGHVLAQVVIAVDQALDTHCVHEVLAADTAFLPHASISISSFCNASHSIVAACTRSSL